MLIISFRKNLVENLKFHLSFGTKESLEHILKLNYSLELKNLQWLNFHKESFEARIYLDTKILNYPLKLKNIKYLLKKRL